MAIRIWLVGCSMVCALATSFVTSAVHAEPIGGMRQSEGLQAPAFGQPASRIPDSLDAGLPAVANGLNEADISLETTMFKPDGAGPFR